MSNSLCKSSVLRIYQEVIDDVISGVRELFLEDGVDEQLLQELKSTWETKLMASKAVQNEPEEKVIKKEPVMAANGIPKQVVQQVPQQVVQQQVQMPTTEVKMVPIQITLPPQPGSDGTQRVLTIHVPASALQGNQLQKVLTGPVITASMGLPANIASSLLQQHVNAAFGSQAVAQPTPATVVLKSLAQTDGAADEENDPVAGCSGMACQKGQQRNPKKTKKIPKVTQMDGPNDTSDDEDEASDDNDDDDDIDDEKDDDNEEIEDEGAEEEPLNSEDDVTDDDPADLFDTDNIVVCQYDKIIRNRNRWKFYLKDGIMNLNGLDYVFQKANGDAEW